MAVIDVRTRETPGAETAPILEAYKMLFGERKKTERQAAATQEKITAADLAHERGKEQFERESQRKIRADQAKMIFKELYGDDGAINNLNFLTKQMNMPGFAADDEKGKELARQHKQAEALVKRLDTMYREFGGTGSDAAKAEVNKNENKAHAVKTTVARLGQFANKRGSKDASYLKKVFASVANVLKTALPFEFTDDKQVAEWMEPMRQKGDTTPLSVVPDQTQTDARNKLESTLLDESRKYKPYTKDLTDVSAVRSPKEILIDKIRTEVRLGKDLKDVLAEIPEGAFTEQELQPLFDELGEEDNALDTGYTEFGSPKPRSGGGYGVTENW